MKTKQRTVDMYELLARYVNDDQRDIADDYVYDGSEEFNRTQDGHIIVTMGGSRKLPCRECVFGTLGGELFWYCDCPESQHSTAPPCPHILAALNGAQDLGLLDRNGVMPIKQLYELSPQIPRNVHPQMWKMSRNKKPQLITELEAKALVAQIPKPKPVWKPLFEALRRSGGSSLSSTRTEPRWPIGKELLYVVDMTVTMAGTGLVVDTMSRERKKDGEWKKPAGCANSAELVKKLPDPADREIIALLAGAKSANAYYYRDESSTRRTPRTS